MIATVVIINTSLTSHHYPFFLVGVQVLVWICFSSLAYTPSSGIDGSYDNSVFNELEFCEWHCASFLWLL